MPARVAAQIAAHLQVLAHRHVGEDAPPLRAMRDAAARGSRAGAARVMSSPSKMMRPAHGRQQAGDGLERGGLARAVGADQR